MTGPAEPTGPCRVDMSFQMRYVGSEFKMPLREEIQYAANARITRILHLDDPVTKDFRTDRLNILLGEDGKINALTCG
ncbi:I78 family peptidase inhibitor [Sphingomonas sp. CFBP 8760]|uniref:I78 family peptidase inhibitor n=1 Tax=Sphingomonas sp. CFBP 8760 TaxID=2775282 RepID=UPI00177D55EC|nr:I78 family peptidase inhibitor [Sphingomonas sp. CFBP 8760]MBD8547354.1 hypothetical protein [Sphingomonas sp. CFBP 8760]